MVDTRELIQAVDAASTPARLVETVRELAQVRSEEAIDKLIDVLSYNNPGAAMVAVEGLVQLGDTAVPTILNHIDSYDYGARAWSIRALSRIGNPLALEILIASAEADFALSVRRAAAKGLGSLRWSILESIEAIASARERALGALLKVSARDEEWVVRYAAVVGLEDLAQSEPFYRASILEHFGQRQEQDDDLCVRSRLAKAIAKLQTHPV